MLEARIIAKARARHVTENVTNQKGASRPRQNISNQKRGKQVAKKTMTKYEKSKNRKKSLV